MLTIDVITNILPSRRLRPGDGYMLKIDGYKLKIVRNFERGQTLTDWLTSYHTFSFNTYYNPEMMNFRSLRVINEDYVEKGVGFPMHSHKDMEIITYVINGELAHKDSLGNGSVISTGEVQYMRAGSGISHSEFNNSQNKRVHFLQIWIMPNQKSLNPSYEQKFFAESDKKNSLKLIVSGDGRDDSIKISQDADLYLSKIDPGEKIVHIVKPGRSLWLQVINGSVEIDVVKELLFSAGDAVGVEGEINKLSFHTHKGAEVLLFDLG